MVIKNAEYTTICTEIILLYKIYMCIDWCDLGAIGFTVHLIIFLKNSVVRITLEF